MEKPRTRGKWCAVDVIVALLLVHFASLLSYDYLQRVERPRMSARLELHTQIVSRNAPYQYRYRVLVPFAAELLANILQHTPAFSRDDSLEGHAYGNRAFGTAYLLLNFTAITLFLFYLYALLRTFFGLELALFGVAFSVVLVSFTFRDHYFHPWSFWEAAFFSIGMYFLRTKKFLSFTVINLLGVMNRETSAFLCLAFGFLVLPTDRVPWQTWLQRRDVQFALVNGVLWLLAFWILHVAVGYAPATFTLDDAWTGNVRNWRYSLLLTTLLLGPGWVLVVIGLIRGPRFIRRTAGILPFYAGLLFVIGFWWEIRYWMTVLPFLVPALIAGITSFRQEKGHGA